RQRVVTAGVTQARRYVDGLCQALHLLFRGRLFRVAQFLDPQPVPARVHDAETAHRAVALARPQEARDAGDGQLAIGRPQPGRKGAIQVIRIGHGDNDAAIRVLGLEAVHTEEMDVDIFQGHNGTWIWTGLPVGLPEPER